MLQFGMQPQKTLDQPRICLSIPDGTVLVEDGIDAKVVSALEKKGHRVRLISGALRSVFGRGQIIVARRDPVHGTLVLAGGSDPRGDGHAAGW
jgi:gamma-glutamyltranspeptidase/glutathione hydrolase